MIPLDNFNLLPFQFTYNYPYVFSDRVPEDQSYQQSPLQNAFAKIDLKVKMLGKNVTGDHRLFVVLGEREYLQEVAYELESERQSGRF